MIHTEVVVLVVERRDAVAQPLVAHAQHVFSHPPLVSLSAQQGSGVRQTRAGLLPAIQMRVDELRIQVPDRLRGRVSLF